MTAPRPAWGAYVHVPYCAHRCTYCSFTAVTGRESEESYFAALALEVVGRADEIPGPLETVYFGGGTPSYAGPAHLSSVLGLLGSLHGLSDGAEVTAEANPDDLDDSRVRELALAGVNRMSVGIQSTRDKELEWLERRHDGRSALAALTRARETFTRVSADVMIGIPGQTRESLGESLAAILATGVGHVSAYILEMEKAPRLLALRAESPGLFADDDEVADRWHLVDGSCAAAGLARYELSNWAKPGEESRHNLKYWRREPVAGYGVSAHSFDGVLRRANSGSIAEYLRRAAGDGKAFVSRSRLEAAEALREEAILGLRLAVGIPEGLFASAAGTVSKSDRQRLREAREAGLLETSGGRVRLTPRGVLLSNEVFAAML